MAAACLVVCELYTHAVVDTTGSGRACSEASKSRWTALSCLPLSAAAVTGRPQHIVEEVISSESAQGP